MPSNIYSISVTSHSVSLHHCFIFSIWHLIDFQFGFYSEGLLCSFRGVMLLCFFISSVSLCWCLCILRNCHFFLECVWLNKSLWFIWNAVITWFVACSVFLGSPRSVFLEWYVFFLMLLVFVGDTVVWCSAALSNRSLAF